jgi:glycerate kinase
MRVLIAPDCFGGTLTALQAAEAMAVGWRAGAPHDDVAVLPLADGGPGFVDIVHAALGGDLVPVTVRGPLGEPVPAVVLRTTTAGGVVAYLEAAQVVGLHLVPADRRDPTVTTSAGVGELLRAAVDLGAVRVVVGLGGSATNDAGAGMLAGLGLDAAVLAGGGGGLTEVTVADLRGLQGARRSLAGVDLLVAADVDVPMLGLHGASAGFAAQKGATPEQAQHLERALGHFAAVVAGALTDAPAARGLLGPTSDPHALAQLPGAGAAGGLGFGLAALGARLLPGAEVVADAVGLGAHAADADLLVTGEGALDWQSLHGKVVSAVARQGLARGIPVVVVAGQVNLGRREWGAAGIAGAYAVAETPEGVARSVADPAGTLAARAERVARTWSPA